ncbi:MAG: right-handed parallel beta-helix repeat-containing protein [Armatimonadota bacterium]
MPERITVSVGQRKGDFVGRDHMALQAAVDYVARLGGGTVRIGPGTWEMGNSLFIRDRVHIVGAGDDTVLHKCPSAATPLADDIDWYGTSVRVINPRLFRVGGGILLRGKSPHFDRLVHCKRTVVAIDGDTVYLDRDPRDNFWTETRPEAATLFPVITGDYVNDVIIESLCIDGNRANNDNLNGNYGGGIFIQDCDRITIRNVTSHDNNSDGISWQVCDDLTVEDCRVINNADLGLHAGSGSQRSMVRRNTIVGNSQGFFFCWGVRESVVEDCLIEDSLKFGISIGHRDTDNIVRNCTVRRSGEIGIQFRQHPEGKRDPHRNLFEGNLIEDSGKRGECVAVELAGTAEDVVLRGNLVRDTRRRHRVRNRIGIRIGARIRRCTLEGNSFENLEQEVIDLREGGPAVQGLS